MGKQAKVPWSMYRTIHNLKDVPLYNYFAVTFINQLQVLGNIT